MKDALNAATRQLKEFNEHAIEEDRQAAEDLLEGGTAGLMRIIAMLEADKKGFEDQVWSGRTSVLDPKFDELVALRTYADRWIGRLRYFLEVGDAARKAETAGKPASDKS